LHSKSVDFFVQISIRTFRTTELGGEQAVILTHELFKRAVP
jgi:hypothetical protein